MSIKRFLRPSFTLWAAKLIEGCGISFVLWWAEDTIGFGDFVEGRIDSSALNDDDDDVKSDEHAATRLEEDPVRANYV